VPGNETFQGLIPGPKKQRRTASTISFRTTATRFPGCDSLLKDISIKLILSTIGNPEASILAMTAFMASLIPVPVTPRNNSAKTAPKGPKARLITLLMTSSRLCSSASPLVAVTKIEEIKPVTFSPVIFAFSIDFIPFATISEMDKLLFICKKIEDARVTLSRLIDILADSNKVSPDKTPSMGTISIHTDADVVTFSILILLVNMLGDVGLSNVKFVKEATSLIFSDVNPTVMFASGLPVLRISGTWKEIDSLKPVTDMFEVPFVIASSIVFIDKQDDPDEGSITADMSFPMLSKTELFSQLTISDVVLGVGNGTGGDK